MAFNKESDSYDPRLGATGIPTFTQDWDRLLNVYNISELPVIPADGDPGCEIIPVGIKVLREFFLEAANAHASEVWFDFAPGGEGSIDACFTPSGRSTTVLRLPGQLFFSEDNEMGVFAFLLDSLTDDGMFAIHVSEFRDKPKRNPFDKRGRIIQPTTPPDSPLPNASDINEDDELPGVTESVTIRAFRISLKGRLIPDDMVVQICPRFWHMPTGFTIE